MFSSMSLRVSKRLFMEILLRRRKITSKRAIIIGAGNLGEMIVRNLMKNNFVPYYPAGFLDDDETKVGMYVHGVRVLGNLGDLEKTIEKMQIDTIIISIARFHQDKLKEIYLTARKHKIQDIKSVPHYFMEDSYEKVPIIEQLEDVSLEEIIGRQEITIEQHLLEEQFRDKDILVTGASGSIGAEIVDQLCLFSPRRLILLEIDETELFYQEKRLRSKYQNMGDKIIPILGDIRDYQRLHFVFSQYRPQIIFHAAAYKHVPMVEKNASEAVKVNILGTYNLCKLSTMYNAERFVLISTDKAVNPTSVMGATKRFCEYLAMSFNQENSCKFIAVRFGNVLGSRGSVFPIFVEQIKKGGPVTVTHPEMKRYFMTIREAVLLVLQASAIGNGGEVLVLDMGQPVSILSLAEQMIKFSGLEPYKDIKIEFTGLRPGEKLFEELLTAEEGTRATRHQKIFTANISKRYSREFLEEKVEQLKNCAYMSDSENIVKTLKEVVVTYQPSHNDFF